MVIHLSFKSVTEKPDRWFVVWLIRGNPQDHTSSTVGLSPHQDQEEGNLPYSARSSRNTPTLGHSDIQVQPMALQLSEPTGEIMEIQDTKFKPHDQNSPLLLYVYKS